MKRRHAFKYELRPDGQQEQHMRRFAGSCRFVFNKALALQITLYEQGEKKLGYAERCKQLTQWKLDRSTAWLADTPSQALQQSLKDLERAYVNFFAQRAEFPRFKKRGQGDRFRYPQGCKLDQDNNRIFLPKLGWIRYRNSREVLGKVKHVTVSRGKWCVSIQTEREVDNPFPKGDTLGIDLGVERFATFDRPLPEFDHQDHLAPLNRLKKHEAALRKAQQAMSRKVKFSHNWKKAKAHVQRLHNRISNARRDSLHKATTTISQNHAMVCIEDLQVRNMSPSAAGTVEQPGRNVRAKSGLNKVILDQGWFEFRRQLDDKLAWQGGWLPLRHRTRAVPVRAALMSRPLIARRKPVLRVWPVDLKKTPMS